MLGYLDASTSGLFGKWIYRKMTILFDSLLMTLYIGLLISGYREIGVYIIHHIVGLNVKIPNTHYFKPNFVSLFAFTNSTFVPL
jgi:hypothetical protein